MKVFDKILLSSQIFINENELNSGLYEGSVIGRRLFGTTQVTLGAQHQELERLKVSSCV